MTASVSLWTPEELTRIDSLLTQGLDRLLVKGVCSLHRLALDNSSLDPDFDPVSATLDPHETDKN